ncbi:restriction endonuclease subunit S [Nitrosomonas sp. Nm34]|uniref:restriction endonuclease subunit S n=1 Tax=Nitrosomonas sp. Nm34 TaxID=1881055 RepID=UPI0008EC07F6|nr:restriction endonuclease subunit S [Nitrosomonas sp. Nm34]SFI45643.1 type I restriction enzyme, S subunit [Nitrosomonas sp. Nm34]
MNNTFIADDTSAHDEWPVIPIEQVAEINPRVDKSAIPDDLPVSFVPMSAVGAGDGTIRVDETRLALEVKKGFTAFLEGDVLFAKITPCMENGKMAVVPKIVNGYGFGSTEFHVLRPKSGMDAKYLYYYVSSQSFRAKAERNMTGAVGQRRVPAPYLKECTIPVAPLDQQKRIVAEIEKQFSRLDEAVANLKRVKANLKRYKAAVLKAAVEGRLVETEAERAHREGRRFETGEQLLQRILETRRSQWNGKSKYKEPAAPGTSDLPELPEGWVWATVEQLSYVNVGYAFKSSQFEAEGVRLLRGENIEPGRLRWEDTRYWPVEKVEGYRSLLVQEGEIILAMDRPIVTAGLKLARASHADLPCLLVQRMARMRCINREMEGYLYVAMQTQRFVRHLLGGQTGTQLPHISGSGIASFVLPLPSMVEQHHIVAEVDRRITLLSETEAQVDTNLQRAKSLRQTILMRVFSGLLVKHLSPSKMIATS